MATYRLRESAAPNTMRSKEIEDLKKDLTLNSRQRSLLVGLLLGDGHLETQDGGKTYRLKVEHATKQKEYVEWLYKEWKSMVRSEIYQKERILNGKTFFSCGFSTYSLGAFRFYAQQFYIGKKKIVPRLIKKLLDPLALAIWFMDDGSFKSEKHKTYIIHTVGYSKKDLELLKKALQEKLGIEVALHKQYQNWRLYINSSSAENFRKLIEPYVISSLRYKLGNTLPKE